MLSRNSVRELLDPFELRISDQQIDKLSRYLDLLLRWNQKINLTSLHEPKECITRHFGESLLLSKVISLRGRLLDIGSGGGFPGLAVKLLAPDLEVVLLEPVAKKRAFLKEVARICGMKQVDVLEYRIEDYSRREEPGSFDIVTARAVGGIESLITAGLRLLKPDGWLCMWLGTDQIERVLDAGRSFRWLAPLAIPLSRGRRILAGKARRELAA